MTALHVACSIPNNADCITTLIDIAGAEIDKPDKFGKTAIHYAATANRLKLCEFPLKEIETKIYNALFLCALMLMFKTSLEEQLSIQQPALAVPLA